MSRLLSLSRAARLVGTTRGKLQKRIQDGEITSFEGQLSLSELSKLYPQAKFEDTAMLDRVEEIIERSRFKARSRLPLPTNKESLLARAAMLADELALAKLDLSNYAIFTHKLKSKLNENKQTANPELNKFLHELINWVQTELPVAAETAPAQQLLVQDTMLRLVTAQIQLLPSGHEYLLEGNTSLLEAGLSAGFALNYGCSNGNCGNCKARLISGLVRKTRPHDYCFSESEKAQDYILMCCNTAMTDIIIEADEADSTNDIPQQAITAKVKKIVSANDHVAILNLKTPRTKRLRFLAGQTAKLVVNDELTKILPIASCPCDDMNIQFHISRNDSDQFNKFVLENLKAGDEVGIEGPQGDFILDDDAANPLVFIAMDTGFAPIKSLAEHAITLAHAEHVHLYWLTSGNQEHYMRNQCRAWADAFDSLEYFETTLQHNLDSDKGRAELKTQLSALLSKETDINKCHIYLAGNKTFVEESKKLLNTTSTPRLMYEQID